MLDCAVYITFLLFSRIYVCVCNSNMDNTIGALSPAIVNQGYQAGLLERILKKRHDVERSRIDLFWCSVNLIFALALGFEM